MDSLHHDSERSIRDYVFDESVSRFFIVGLTADALQKSQQSDARVDYLESLSHAESSIASMKADETCTLVLDFSVLTQPVDECLGRALRLSPHRVLLRCATAHDDTQWSDSAFFAFGFHKLMQRLPSEQPTSSIRWFEYRMTSYKSAPDWLNERYWANPERFQIEEDLDQYCDEEE